MTALVRSTEPEVEPLSLAEAKAHLRVTLDDEDALITSLISVARTACEEYTRRALITQGWTLWLDAFPGMDQAWWDGMREGAAQLTVKRFLHLPRPPLQGVEEVVIYDDGDGESVFDEGLYFVDTASEPGRLALRNNAHWPAPLRAHHGISIAFTAGYGDAAEDVPPALRQGMLAHVAALYENRGDDLTWAGRAAQVKLVPEVASLLYNPYRIQHLVLP